jgi:hypothetical protein
MGSAGVGYLSSASNRAVSTAAWAASHPLLPSLAAGAVHRLVERLGGEHGVADRHARVERHT